MPAITIPDLNNAKVDVDHIAKVANSPELTATDRLGHTKRTLAGIDALAMERIEENDALAADQRAQIQASADTVLGSLGYEVPVAYVSGLVMERQSQTVTYNGQTYAPIVGELPFTTTGIFETSKFRLIQGVSGADLGSATGSRLVGSGGPVITPFLQTLSDIQAGNAISLYRFVNPVRIPAMRSFSTTYDASGGMQDAFDSGAKRLVAEYGLFNLESSIVTASSVTLDGAGDGSIFNQVSVSQRASFEFTSSADGSFIEGIRLSNFVLQCLTGTFAEQQHLAVMNGVRNAKVSALRFVGFRGDGLYIGSGGAGEMRHNENVRVEGCFFDGVNNENRNALSVIDVDGMLVFNNFVTRCTRSNMPGPFDFEPNANAGHILRNVSVCQNRFRSNGGNIAEIGVPVSATVSAAPRNFLIADNDSDGYVGSGSFFLWATNRNPTATSDDGQIQLVGNRARNGNRPFSYADGNRVVHERNVWQDMKQAAVIGSVSGATSARNLVFRDERFIRCGSVGGNGLSIFNVTNLQFKNTEMVDCGTGVAGSSNAVDFSTGTSSTVSFDGLRVSAPTGKTLIAIQKEAGHTFDAATNSFFNSDVGGLSNFFAAQFSDSIENSYTPIVEGTTTAGVGTYTTQFGRLMRIGKRCFVRIKIVLTAHTGTGILKIGLPVPVKSTGGAAEYLFNVQVDGATSSGGQIALLVQTATVNGVLGALYCYSQGTGTRSQINLPSGASTIFVNGSYLTD